MLAQSWGSEFCLSVHASVTRVLCDKMKEHTANTLIPHERVITLIFWSQQRFIGDVPFHVKFVLKLTHPFEKRRLRPISAYNVWTIRASKNVELSRIGSQPRTFQWARDEVRALPLTPPKGGSNSEFVVLMNIIHVQSNKVCYKVFSFLCVKMSIGKVVVEWFPYLGEWHIHVGGKRNPST